MKNILLIGCGHMGGSLMSGWSNSKNYTISVIDKKKYSILKKRNRNKKIKFFKSIDDINNQNNLDYIIFATRPLELTNVFNELKNAIELKEQWAFKKNNRKKALVEFVSSNPTGPLHVGHGRGAVLGIAISNLLQSQGYQVDKEYYVNDAGRQINILALSTSLYERKKYGFILFYS